MSEGAGQRCLLWVQHLLGTGHLRRALAVAAGLGRRGVEVVVVSGGLPVPWSTAPGVRLLQLPPISASDPSFRGLVDEGGSRVGHELWQERRALLLQAFEALRPTLLLTEMYPFGRRLFDSELLPLLERARMRDVPVASSVRDILVTKRDPRKLRQMRDLCNRWYELVLVHGDETLLPFVATFPLAAELAPALVHTGYVAEAGPPRSQPERLGVLVSAGGGAVGTPLLRAALVARALSSQRHAPWRLVTGSRLSEAEATALERDLPPGVTLERFRGGLQEILSTVAISVSQAGYNTVVEALVAATPMALVPFGAAGEDEQMTRAMRLADRGLATVVPEGELEPARLAAAIDAALSLDMSAAGSIRIDGAERSADHLLRLGQRKARG
jgi:predicted glycosyltransferase